MARFHLANIVPTKEQIIADWAPQQSWGPAAGVPIDVIGSYRFDDPDGSVGMEAFIAAAGHRLFHIPLTYRDAPLEGADEALVATMDHSVLGQRWVYDGLRDPRFVVMMAAGTMTGQGEALGMAVYDDRWYIAPSKVRIRGGGWTLERVPVDGFTAPDVTDAVVNFANDRFQLTVFRHPQHGRRAPIELTATWAGQTDPVVLAEVRDLAAPAATH